MYINVILFDDFEAMDVFVPASIFGCKQDEFHVRYLSMSGDVVNASSGAKIWTDYLVPEEIEGAVLIPGGNGARRLLHNDPRFLAALKKSVEHAETCFMVGNSSTLMAQTGLLYSRLVAECKLDTNMKRMFTAQVRWVPDSRWISDGKYYSCASSGDTAAMILGYISDNYDISVAEKISDQLGLRWDPDDFD